MLQTLVNDVNSAEEQEMNIFNVLETIQARMGEDSAKLGDNEKSILSMVCLCVEICKCVVISSHNRS